MKKTSDEKRLEELRETLRNDMTQAGVKISAYDIAIEITAETLLEREKAYEAYINDGSRQVDERGRLNPYGSRLASWNSQARACLSMLKLTPTRVFYSEASEE